MPALLLSMLLFQSAPGLPSGSTPSVITQPDWVSRPTADDVAGLYPKAAADAGVEGRATMRCKVTAAGLLADCAVTVQDPPDAGFGGAALGMAAKFQMRPMTKDGQPVNGGVVQIPIRFLLPKPSDAEPPGTTPAVIRPAWARTPSAEELARAYPRRGNGAIGDVRLRCVIAANGRFDSCDVISETPAGLGFGAAGLEVSKLFRMTSVDGDGGKVAGRAIRIPIRFDPPVR